MKSMTMTEPFTKAKPTEAGYYWWRSYRYKVLVLYRVFGSSPRELWARRVDIDQLCDRLDVDEMGGEWCGPIAIPYPVDDNAPANNAPKE